MKKLPNYHSPTFKLLYKRTLIGTITNVGTDQPYFMGDLEVTPAYEPFRKGFAVLTSKEAQLKGIDPALDLEHWYVEDEDGVRAIAYVAVHDDGKSIIWRW
ncbi:MAG: hypothetical protein U0105_21550 [Candidatus Obscuribacterales bacterium]